MANTVIFFVIESGYLEVQSILLARSLRELCQVEDSEYTIMAIKPHRGLGLQKDTYDQLTELKIDLIECDLNHGFHFYPLTNKIFVSAYIEEHFNQDFENFIFLDSDILVLQPLDSLIKRDFKIALKPDDVNRIGLSKNESPDLFWQLVYESCNVEVDDHWFIRTSVNKLNIRAYFNSGVIIKKESNDLFRIWKQNFLKAITDKRSFHLDYLHYYFLEQATLSSTIVRLYNQSDVELLDNSYNYPLPYDQEIKHEIKDNGIRIMHYRNFNFLYQYALKKESLLSDHHKAWILKNASEKTIQKNAYSRMKQIINYQVHKLKYKFEILPRDKLFILIF